MSVYKLNMEQLRNWVGRLIAERPVYGVRQKDERFVFGRLKKPEELRLDYDVTILPPKKYILPTRENLLAYQPGEHYESLWADEPFVLLGVHPYDFVAIRQLDLLFEREKPDEHYLRRRRAATIIVADVERASDNVFAGCVGTAVVKDAFDGLLTRVEDGYLLEVRGEKGEWLASLLESPSPANAAELSRRNDVWENNRRRLRKHELKVPPEQLGDLLRRSVDHPLWEEKARLCYSCGSCNLVCPTCYCFDVRDESDWSLDKGVRYRVWDGCLLEDFAMVAGGHNFRPTRAARYRHRYYRKGLYVPEMIGELACVGCGRCITACTAGIANPVEVYNRLQEEPHEDDAAE
ncbi:MAG: Ni/Fe hydrogenase subunit beta [Verrucomicrobia bacterium]|nr:MAG: Ni/Fe hydrogenase subunit beta [Verrucomicrobiota bacterium]